MAFPLRDDSSNGSAPWATWALMAACVIVFLFLQPSVFQRGAGDNISERSAAYLSAQHFANEWGLVPCEVSHLRSMHDGAACNGYASDHPERYPAKQPLVPLVAHLFLHGSVLHLAGNMLFLWVFGRAVEERLGAGSLLLLFLLGGLVAALGYVGLHSESTQPLVGASGAIAAVMGAYLVLRPRERILSIVYAAGLQVVYLPAWAILGLFFVTQFFTPGQDGVAWEAHVVGMVFGAVTGICVRRFTQPHGSDPAEHTGSPDPLALRADVGPDLPF